MSASKDKTMDVYHYTDKKGYEGIKESGVIKQSTDTTRDAIFGKGVYLTTQPPRTPTMQLVKNNWDDVTNRSQAEELARRTEYYVKSEVPRSMLSKVGSQRDVYRFSGDFPLDKFNSTCSKRDSK